MRYALIISLIIFVICVFVALFAALLEGFGWHHNVDMETLGGVTAASEFAVLLLFLYSLNGKDSLE